MQSAGTPLPNDAPPIRVNEIIKVKGGRRAYLGSCNACAVGQYEVGQAGDDLVTEVQLRGLNFRLCCACRNQLKEML